jgi:hypothetical protein
MALRGYLLICAVFQNFDQLYMRMESTFVMLR